MELDPSVYISRNLPFELYEVDILNASDELAVISDEMGLALSVDEMRRIKEYFRQKGRNPTDIELQALGQAWSEHCCYKSSKYFLKKYLFGIEAPQNIFVIEEDAGVVEFDEEHAYVVALESHNHPSAIEPYGGAATGIGGILRDVVCMGAQPVALVDPLFFGHLDTPYEALPSGVKHPLYLMNGVVAGIRDYGNRVGIPTVAGMIFFDEGYTGNCLVNVGCVGIAKKNHLIRSRVGGVGDVFVLVGGKTGRDGIHGVTFASTELDEKSEEESRGAVQLGNPIVKEPLIHACLEANEKGLLTGMKDLGGGGLSCVIGEMALAGGFGAEVHLERVPLKEKEIKPWEIWVSESQERMMLSVRPENVDEVLYIFDKWDVDATVIGKVIDEKILRVFYQGYKIYEMDIEFVTSGPEYCRPYTVEKREIQTSVFDVPEPEDYEDIFRSILAHPNVASKEFAIRQYDHEVRASTVLKPLNGIAGWESHGDAAVIKPLEDSWKGLAITSDVNPAYTKIDPFWGTAVAFDEMCRNLVAVNSVPHSFADCLNFGNPEKPLRLGDFHESVRALGWMARNLGIPCVSGNVSFYNETPYSFVPPTPTLMGVGMVEDVRKVISMDLKRRGTALILINETRPEFGGSVYSSVRGFEDSNVPKSSPEHLRKSIETMLSLFSNFRILSCHDVAEGGVAVALGEMCIGGHMGCEVEIRAERADIALFSESATRWIVEVKEEDYTDVVEFLRKSGLKAGVLGFTGGKDMILRGAKTTKPLIYMNIDEVDTTWRNGLSRYMG
jgi:phosphoribosylformylglycinamidine synthase